MFASRTNTGLTRSPYCVPLSAPSLHTVALNTGMSERYRLRWTKVDFDLRLITIPCASSGRRETNPECRRDSSHLKLKAFGLRFRKRRPELRPGLAGCSRSFGKCNGECYSHRGPGPHHSRSHRNVGGAGRNRTAGKGFADLVSFWNTLYLRNYFEFLYPFCTHLAV